MANGTTVNSEFYQAMREGGFEEKPAMRAAAVVPSLDSIPDKAEVEILKVDRDNAKDAFTRIDERMAHIDAAIVEVQKEQVRMGEKINSLHDLVMRVLLSFLVVMTTGIFGILGVMLYQISK